jgi:Domain of unknown function (DUF4279)
MNDEITVKLTIVSSTLSAKNVDDLLGMRADSSQIMGQINRLGTKTYPQHAWILKSRHELDGEAIEEQMETHVSQFLDRLATVAPTIKGLSSEHLVELGIYVLVREVPPLGLSSKQVAAIAELGASIDLDVVLYAETES